MKLSELKEKTNKTAWVILFTPDKLIMGKRSPSTKNPNQWNFFGGHVDSGETAESAAARELFEETKFKINPSQLKKISEIGNATYFSLKINGESDVSTSTEISKVKSFKLTDLPDNLHTKTQNFFDKLDNLLK